MRLRNCRNQNKGRARELVIWPLNLGRRLRPSVFNYRLKQGKQALSKSTKSTDCAACSMRQMLNTI
ncbi:MAG: hypothetical protein DME33_05045 [Verrucomicrobia bacterium]|nr:MAG: hypothetical protein DME33_05045 [Verrucomicrobiota bacterium]